MWQVINHLEDHPSARSSSPTIWSGRSLHNEWEPGFLWGSGGRSSIGRCWWRVSPCFIHDFPLVARIPQSPGFAFALWTFPPSDFFLMLVSQASFLALPVSPSILSSSSMSLANSLSWNSMYMLITLHLSFYLIFLPLNCLTSSIDSYIHQISCFSYSYSDLKRTIVLVNYAVDF